MIHVNVSFKPNKEGIIHCSKCHRNDEHESFLSQIEKRTQINVDRKNFEKLDDQKTINIDRIRSWKLQIRCMRSWKGK